MVLNLCISNDHALIFVPSFNTLKISRRILELLSGHDFPTKIYKGALFHKNIGGVLALVLCTSSNDALYLYHVF